LLAANSSSLPVLLISAKTYPSLTSPAFCFPKPTRPASKNASKRSKPSNPNTQTTNSPCSSLAQFEPKPISFPKPSSTHVRPKPASEPFRFSKKQRTQKALDLVSTKGTTHDWAAIREESIFTIERMTGKK
jgi:hypothetical protein